MAMNRKSAWVHGSKLFHDAVSDASGATSFAPCVRK